MAKPATRSAAAQFERGKACLQLEDTAGAAAAFAEAARLDPTFVAAFGNLGAALGELGRRDEALAALEQARHLDPTRVSIVNNIGVVNRDLGRLADAEAAFRRAIELEPSFAFGHYNLGQTLLLQGRSTEARDAYETGQERDPQKNPRQACRLAVARAAAGDAPGALNELAAVAESLPIEMMRDLAGEAEETLTALSARSPAWSAELAAVLAAVRRYRATPRS